MFSKRHPLAVLLTLLAISVVGCTEEPSTNIDAEPALAVLGGVILATQNEGRLARIAPPRKGSDGLLRWIDPIAEAFAAPPACQPVTTGTCNGSDLEVFYDNCQMAGFGEAGYWRSYFRYTFPTGADCLNVQINGFSATGVAGLVGKTITRNWGLGANGDQFNIRVGAKGEATYFYSDFPSGWRDDRIGGMDITFETATRRRIVVNGAHAIGVSQEVPMTPVDVFDLKMLPTTGEGITTEWDHTINTVKTGDLLFELGVRIIRNADFTISFDSIENDVTASFDGDIVVNGNTVERGAMLRAQHNLSQSLGVLVVTQPLVYSDPTCCWPMSGTVAAKYDQNLRTPTIEEEVVFTGTACGAVIYTSTAETEVEKTLQHCF